MTQKYTITPAPGYIVVEPIKAEEFNKTQLAQLSNDRERVVTGRVISVSEYAGVFENYSDPVICTAKTGDVIVYAEYSSQTVKVNNFDFHLVPFSKVIATLEEEK